ncbi:MAG: nucleoside 2-deoxyribosyltransferase [Thermofilaceae archaeon]
MRIYLAAPMKGVRAALDTVRAIYAALREIGCEVLTPHVVDEVLDVERGLTPEEVYERDVKLLEEADALVAEVSYPSLGVGFEIAYALLKGKRVIALCLESRLAETSALIRGIRSPNFKFVNYSGIEDAIGKLIDELRCS